MKKIKDPIPLDDGRFPKLNMRRTLARGQRAEQRFNPPVIGPRQARGVYEVCQYMNSLQEVTLAFKDNRKFI